MSKQRIIIGAVIIAIILVAVFVWYINIPMTTEQVHELF